MPNIRPLFKFGAATGTAALGLSQIDEAEAFPRGVFKKAVSRGTKMLSSASERLAGKELHGRTIKQVTKSRGQFRVIQFTDDTEMVVKKQEINDLARHFGTEKYLEKFAAQNEEGQMMQALKSMGMHEKTAKPFMSRRHIRELTKRHIRRKKEMGVTPDRAELVFVTRGRKLFQMPYKYAQLLEEEGYLKIAHSREDLKALMLQK